MLSVFVVQLGGKRSLANPGRVLFHHTNGDIQNFRRNPQPGQDLTLGRVRGCDVGVGSKINIQQLLVLALHQDFFALLDRFVHQTHRIHDLILDQLPVAPVQFFLLLQIDLDLVSFRQPVAQLGQFLNKRVPL